MVESKAQFQLTGNVKIYSHPADFTYEDFKKLTEKEKEECLVFAGDNLVVNAGLNQIVALLIATNTNSITYCGVGSNSTAVTAADTDLNTAIGSRLAITNRYAGTTGVGHFDTFYSSSSNNGTWLETGLFDASSSGNMICRKIISSFVKSSTNTATVAWTLTLSAI